MGDELAGPSAIETGDIANASGLVGKLIEAKATQKTDPTNSEVTQDIEQITSIADRKLMSTVTGMQEWIAAQPLQWRGSEANADLTPFVYRVTAPDGDKRYIVYNDTQTNKRVIGIKDFPTEEDMIDVTTSQLLIREGTVDSSDPSNVFNEFTGTTKVSARLDSEGLPLIPSGNGETIVAFIPPDQRDRGVAEIMPNVYGYLNQRQLANRDQRSPRSEDPLDHTWKVLGNLKKAQLEGTLDVKNKTIVPSQTPSK